MASISDPVKAYAIQQGQIPNTQNDPQLDAVLQSLLIDDPDLKRILKGEVHDYLNKLNQMMVFFQQRAPMLLEYFSSNKQSENTLLLTQLMAQSGEILKQLQAIEVQLKKYRRYVPYLMLITPTSVLSNVTMDEAKKLFRKVDIMITRDELDCEDDDELFEGKNFFDAFRVTYYLHVMRNVDGHTFHGLIEEKRTVTNIVQDNTQQNRQRKKVLGVF